MPSLAVPPEHVGGLTTSAGSAANTTARIECESCAEPTPGRPMEDKGRALQAEEMASYRAMIDLL